MSDDDDLDPMAALEEEARRLSLEEKAAVAFSHARGRLVLGRDATHAFFAGLALRLRPQADWTAGTGWTDGRTLAYDPAWLVQQTPAQAKGFVAHEVGHNFLNHIGRGAHLPDRRKANVAADAVLNPLLLDAGFELPEGGIVAGRRPGPGCPPAWADVIEQADPATTMEKLYDLLPDLPGGGGEGPGDGDGAGGPGGNPDPGGCGGIKPPGDGSEAARRQNEAEWREAVAQAAHAARHRGDLPAGLDRLVRQALAPAVNWREVLREFVTRHARADYHWTRPNRRFAAQGLYLPSRHSDELGVVVVVVDCSGSVGDDELALFGGEVQGIVEAFPSPKLTIVYHEEGPRHVQRWTPDDGPLNLEAKGGGGTSHRWLPTWLDEHADEAACVVLLTDCATEYPDRAPELPCLWAVVGNPGARPPFGRVVEVA